MMQCREVRDRADSFLSEELLVETNHEVLRHLEGYSACCMELAWRQGLRTATEIFRHAGNRKGLLVIFSQEKNAMIPKAYRGFQCK